MKSTPAVEGVEVKALSRRNFSESDVGANVRRQMHLFSIIGLLRIARLIRVKLCSILCLTDSEGCGGSEFVAIRAVDERFMS